MKIEKVLSVQMILHSPANLLPKHEERVLFWYGEELELGIGCFRVDESRWRRDEFELLWNGSIPATNVLWWAQLPDLEDAR